MTTRPARIIGLGVLALAVCSVWLVGAPLSRADGLVRTTARDKSWIKVSDEDGIACFKREVPRSPIIALRGEGVIDAPIARVASVLLDYSRATEWVDSLAEVRVVRMLGPQEFIEYDHVDTPPVIMADRDFVVRGKVEVDVQARTLALRMWPAKDPLVPEQSSYVRGELSGYWELRSIADDKRTFVIAEMHGDPKGGVAKWLVNWFQENWPRNTFESLRKQVHKRDIRVIPQVQDAFAGKPIHFVAPSNRATK
jgi:hypothetical protein